MLKTVLFIIRLVGVSGRTREAIESLLHEVQSHPDDSELVALLHEIHSTNIPGHSHRGYIVLPSSQEAEPFIEIQVVYIIIFYRISCCI